MTTVNHPRFGQGTIISESNGNITIDFGGNEKTLIVKFANLTNEDGTAYGEQFVPKEAKAKKLNKSNFMSKADLERYNAIPAGELERQIEENRRNSLPSSMR